MTRALSTMQDKVTSVKQLLHQHSKSLVAALPKQIGVERFSRIVMTSVTLTPDLLDCSPNSLLAAVLTCAQLGLEPDGVRNMAHLVPFGKKVTFIPGYMGLMDLSMRSGKFRNIEAHIVYAQDEFDYAHGSTPFISHKPAYEKADRGEQIAAYCIAFFKDGGFQFRVMPMTDIRAIRDRSPAGRRGPWVTDFDAMALKTVIRHTVKYLPSSVVDQSLSLAVSLDERAETGIDQQLEVISGIDTTTGEIIEQPGKSALDELAEKHGAPPEPATTPPPAPEPSEDDGVSAEDRAFIAKFKGLHKSGFTKFLREEKVQVELAILPPDSPVWKAIDEKHQRFWGGPCPRPSLASPLPTGPSPEPPPEPPAGPTEPEVTEPPEMPPAPPEETEPPLFGEGVEPEEIKEPEPGPDLNLASIERTLEIDKFVKDTYQIQLKAFHDWAITTKRMIMGRYTGYFSHVFATDPDTEIAAFHANQGDS